MRFFTLCLAFFFAPLAAAELVFEAFYRLEKNGKHHGYFIERVAQDSAAKTKTITMYSRQQHGGGGGGDEAFISYRSVAQLETGAPISSKYSSSFSGVPVDILASFKNGVGTIINTVNKKKAANTTARKTDNMSAFLFLFADLRKLVPGTEYEYWTYAEEAGRRAAGTLVRVGDKVHGGQHFLHLVNDYLGRPMESFVTEAGDAIGARDPATDFEAFWVANKEDAVGQFSYPTAEFTALFGDLPRGDKNPWVKSALSGQAVVRSFPKSLGSRTQGSRAISSQKNRKVARLPLRKI